VLTWINPFFHSPCAASFWICSQFALRKIHCGEEEGFPPTAQSASLHRFRLKDTHTTQFNLQPKKSYRQILSQRAMKKVSAGRKTFN
jgi:hypothetical protein